MTTSTVVVGSDEGQPLHIAYSAYGQPTAQTHLLLVHGLFDDQRTWQLLLPQLVRADRYVVTVDLLGAGRSSRPLLSHLPADQRYSADLHVEHLRRVISQLRLRNLVLIGNSLGGGLLLRMLCTPWPNRPELRALVLEDAAGYAHTIPGMMRLLINWPGRCLMMGSVRWLVQTTGIARHIADRSIRRAFADPAAVSPAFVDRYLEILTSAAAIHACRETIRNMVPSDMETVVASYRCLDLPTLVCWGKQDRVLSPLYGQRFAEDIPSADLHIFEDCGHAPHLEQPTRMAQRLNSWLDQLDAAELEADR